MNAISDRLRVALVSAALAVLVPQARGQDLGDLLSGVKGSPAPEWAVPGTRLTYYSALASVPGSLYYYTPNENGDWESGDGKRWDQWENPGSAAHGYTSVDFLAVEPDRAVMSLQSWGKDLITNKISPLAGKRSGQTSLPGGGDWWIHPRALAAVPQFLQIRGIEEMKVLRMRQKTIHGKFYDVLRFQFEYEKSRHVIAYELATGLLIFKASVSSGTGGRFSRGNTNIFQIWYTERRRLQLPWGGAAIHEGLSPGRSFQYQGTLTTIVPAAGHTMTLPLTADLRVTGAGRNWFTYDQTARMGALPGMPAPAPEVTKVASGTWQVDPMWIPPAVLGQLRAGQVIDQDPTLRETTSVKSAGAGSVVISSVGEAAVVERTYDAASGLMVEGKTAGGPSDLAKTVVELRLSAGALGPPAPRVEPPPQEGAAARPDRCRNCREPLSPQAKFCPECGTKVDPR
jgi:hypothetical protein